MTRRQPVARIDVTHREAVFEEDYRAAERARRGVPEQVVPKPAPVAPKPPSPVRAPVVRMPPRTQPAKAPPAPTTPPVPPSPVRGGRPKPPPSADSVTVSRAEWKLIEKLIDAATEGLRRAPASTPRPVVNRQPPPTPRPTPKPTPKGLRR